MATDDPTEAGDSGPTIDPVDLLLSHHAPDWGWPVREIHPDDEMLRRDRWLPEQARVEYFHTGLLAARTLSSVLAPWLTARLAARREARETTAARPLRVLDFAAGYGRVTRFLVARFPEIDWWVSELEPAAVAFQRRALGVRGFDSALRPEDLLKPEDPRPPTAGGEGGAGFDVVLVSSLFSHLPERTFQPWLAALAALLAPGGLLAFSVLDEAVLPSVFTMPQEGLFFEPASELEHRVEPGDYGRTWVTEGFVRRTLATAWPEGRHVRRHPRALWHYQDLWLASADVDCAALDAPVDGGPDGRVAAVGLEGDPARDADVVLLEGWAVHPSEPDRPVRVEAWSGEERLAVTEPTEPREDVAHHFGASGAWPAGWRLRLPAPAGQGLRTVVRLVVVDEEGLDRLLHLGSLESLLADHRLAEREARAQARERRWQRLDEKYRALEARHETTRQRVEALERGLPGRLRRWWERWRPG